MKKITLLVFASLILLAADAQTQRKKTMVAADSATTAAPAKTRGQKKQMMKDLNLSREQKSKLKGLQQANKAKMDEIKNNDKLTPEEKEAKLKAVRQEQLKSTGAVLNDEQKAKMKQLIKEKQKNKKKNAAMDQQ